MTIVLGKWDHGLDFIQARLVLENYIKNMAALLISTLPNKHKINGSKFVYASAAYIQLLNGTRVSEAIEALKIYVETKKIDIVIKAKKTNVDRFVRIPELIRNYQSLYDVYRDIVMRLESYHLKNFLKLNFGWNTHSLRYAFIRYSIERGVPADVLSILIGHVKLDTTLNYARKIRADKILESIQVDTPLPKIE
jgi:Phage integrase family.